MSTRNDTDQGIYRVETFSWMQLLKPVNSTLSYYAIGKMLDFKTPTLAVSQNGTGASYLYCVEHKFVYPLKGVCTLCQEREAALPSPAPTLSAP